MNITFEGVEVKTSGIYTDNGGLRDPQCGKAAGQRIFAGYFGQRDG